MNPHYTHAEHVVLALWLAGLAFAALIAAWCWFLDYRDRGGDQ